MIQNTVRCKYILFTLTRCENVGRDPWHGEAWVRSVVEEVGGIAGVKRRILQPPTEEASECEHRAQ